MKTRLEWTWMFKVPLMDATVSAASEEVKGRVFHALATRPFGRSHYNTIGVEFGWNDLLIDDLDDESQCCIKLQVWCLNGTGRYRFLWRDYIRGGSMIMIAHDQAEDPNFIELAKHLDLCINECEEIMISIVSVTHLDPVDYAAILEEQFHRQVIIVDELDEFFRHLVYLSSQRENTMLRLPLFLLCLESPRDIPVPPEREDFNLGECNQVSEHLKTCIQEAGLKLIDGRYVFLDTKQYMFVIDLKDINLYAAPATCLDCAKFSPEIHLRGLDGRCSESFKRVCVILKSSKSPGYASKGTGINHADLFVLSMIFSIIHELLPPDVTTQFPRKKTCSPLWKIQ